MQVDLRLAIISLSVPSPHPPTLPLRQLRLLPLDMVWQFILFVYVYVRNTLANGYYHPNITPTSILKGRDAAGGWSDFFWVAGTNFVFLRVQGEGKHIRRS